MEGGHSVYTGCALPLCMQSSLNLEDGSESLWGQLEHKLPLGSFLIPSIHMESFSFSPENSVCACFVLQCYLGTNFLFLFV